MARLLESDGDKKRPLVKAASIGWNRKNPSTLQNRPDLLDALLDVFDGVGVGKP